MRTNATLQTCASHRTLYSEWCPWSSPHIQVEISRPPPAGLGLLQHEAAPSRLPGKMLYSSLCEISQLATHLSLGVVGQKVICLLQSHMVVSSPHLQLLNSIFRKSTLAFQQKFTHPALDHTAEVSQLDNLGSGRRANGLSCLPLDSSQRDSLSFSDGKRTRLATEHRVHVFLCIGGFNCFLLISHLDLPGSQPQPAPSEPMEGERLAWV